jgi:methyl-accepting chemotaxis protein
LTWQLVLPVPVLICAVLAAASVYVHSAAEDSAVEAAVRNAEVTVAQFKELRSYYTKNVVKKAVASGALKPRVDLPGFIVGQPVQAVHGHVIRGVVLVPGLGSSATTRCSPIEPANTKRKFG